MSNKQLPATINPSKWLAGSWSTEACARYARSTASTNACRVRTAAPPEEAKRLLQELGESAAMWLTLRKHLRVVDAIVILKVLRDHSDWPRVKRTEDEVLRREYLALF